MYESVGHILNNELNNESRNAVMAYFAHIVNLKRKTPDLTEELEESKQRNHVLAEKLREREQYDAMLSAKQKELFDTKVQEEVNKQLGEFYAAFTTLNKTCDDMRTELGNKNLELMTMKLKHGMEIEKRDATIRIQKAKLENLNAPPTHILVLLAKESPCEENKKYRVVRTLKNNLASSLSDAHKYGYIRELVRLPVCHDNNWGLIKSEWNGAHFSGHYATLKTGFDENMFVAMIHNYESTCVKV